MGDSPHDISLLVGNTPLIRLSGILPDLPADVEVYGKAEYFNPGGSVKDRAALSMILAAERDGTLTKDKVVLDATSGNTGIAYAWIAASRGYRVALCLPANASPERKKILAAYGAQLILTDPRYSTDGAQKKARELVSENPGKYFYPDQYNNDNNWRAHFETTGPEIWDQTGGRISHFVTGLGTTGTFVGVGRYLRSQNPAIRLIAMQPASPMHGLEGMKHLATALVPGIWDASLPDETIRIETEDAYTTCRCLAKLEGLFVGPSSGGNVYAAIQVAKTVPVGSVVVTVLCDGGDKYMSEPFWSNDLDPCPQI
jgi:cysteine synthase B